MTTVDNTTSTTPLPLASTPPAKAKTGAADVAMSANNANNASAGAAPASSSSSVISLSTISTQLQASQSTSSSSAVFSTSKVNEIKEAIASGQFKVDSTKVAAALIGGVHDLLSSGRQSNND